MRWSVALAGLLAACVDPVMPAGGVVTLDDGGAGAASDGFVSVSAGREHTCGLVVGGAAYCWGSDEFDQLGAASPPATRCVRDDRSIPCARVPIAVAPGLSFAKISAGGSHTCALSTTGRLYCWGDNLRGGLGDPAVRRSATPVAILPASLFIDVAAGGLHTCAIRSDGVAMCWGANDFGQLGIGSSGLGAPTPATVSTALRFVALTIGDKRTCARTASAAAYCWGETWVTNIAEMPVTRPQSTPALVPGGRSFQWVSVGSLTTCGTIVGGAAFCWQGNATGAIGDGSTDGATDPQAVLGARTYLAISNGAAHTCAIAADGLAYCWGSNASSQLGVPPATPLSRCGEAAIPCATTPLRVSGWRRFSQISAGLADHSCALTIGGNVFCWGAGRMGQRGDGRVTRAEWSPVKVRWP